MAADCCLLFLPDRTTFIGFLVDIGTQISIIPANKEDILKGPHQSNPGGRQQIAYPDLWP